MAASAVAARLLVAGVVLVLAGAIAVQAVLSGAQAAADRPALALTGPDGTPVTLESRRGRVLLVFFGYTRCPTVCPTELRWQRLVLAGLAPAEAAQVDHLLVGLDAEGDPPARLVEFAACFDAALVACTGPRLAIDAAVASFGAGYRREAARRAGGYRIDHTAVAFVLDRQGRIADRISSRQPVAEGVDRLRRVIARP